MATRSISDRELELLRGEVEIMRRLLWIKERLIHIGERERVHDYRDAIDANCRIGTCSMNNCLYPDCLRTTP